MKKLAVLAAAVGSLTLAGQGMAYTIQVVNQQQSLPICSIWDGGYKAIESSITAKTNTTYTFNTARGDACYFGGRIFTIDIFPSPPDNTLYISAGKCAQGPNCTTTHMWVSIDGKSYGDILSGQSQRTSLSSFSDNSVVTANFQ